MFPSASLTLIQVVRDVRIDVDLSACRPGTKDMLYMNVGAVFDLLDLNHDEELSRTELQVAAKRLKWHWNEAPLFALIDLFSIPAPIPKHQFSLLMQEIIDDPMGVYGNVLLKLPYFSSPSERQFDQNADRLLEKDLDHSADVVPLLERHAGSNIANAFQRLQGTLETICVSRDDAALLIIDPHKGVKSALSCYRSIRLTYIT